VSGCTARRRAVRVTVPSEGQPGGAAPRADLLAAEEPLGISLAPWIAITPGARRNFLTTSACGVCGKASIEDICVLPHAALSLDRTRFPAAVLASMPDRLRDAQRVRVSRWSVSCAARQ
jgi:hypothetical protein